MRVRGVVRGGGRRGGPPLLVLALAVWLLAMVGLVAALEVQQERQKLPLLERFAARPTSGADFMASYVAEVFRTEQRLVAEVLAGERAVDEFEHHARLLGFEAAVLLDRQGRAVAVMPSSPELVGDPLVGRYPHLQAAMDGERVVSDVVLSAVGKEPIVAFALPIADGRFAVLSGGFQLDDSALRTFVSKHPIPGTRGYVVDANGEVVVSSEDAGPPPSEAVREAALEGWTRADGRVIAASEVPGTSWTYVLDVPESTLLAPVTEDDGTWWATALALGLLSLWGIVLLSRSRSARELAAAQREEALERLALTARHAPIGMTLVDMHHRFVEPNESLAQMLGYSRAELETMRFEEVSHPEDLNTDLSLTQQLLEGEIAHYEITKRYLRRDASIFWGLLSVSLVRDDQDRPLHFVSQILDITASKERVTELELFAGVVAHDLKSPLAVILTWGEYLDSELEDIEAGDGDVRSSLERIMRAAQRMNQLIDDLLSFTQSTSGEVALRRVDLSAVLQDVAESLPPEASPLVEQEDLGVVHGDEALVRQLLSNLVGNAVKYTDPGVQPRVVVSSRRHRGVTEVRVTDNGIGIPAGARTRVFDPFYRVTRNGYDGTGLGLAICRRIMDRHHGSIVAEPGPEGRGTTIVCSFPIVPASEEKVGAGTEPRGRVPAST